MAKEIAVSEEAWDAAMASHHELARSGIQDNPDDYRIRLEVAGAVIESCRVRLAPYVPLDVILMAVALTCLSLGATAARLEQEPAPLGL